MTSRLLRGTDGDFQLRGYRSDPHPTQARRQLHSPSGSDLSVSFSQPEVSPSWDSRLSHRSSEPSLLIYTS